MAGETLKVHPAALQAAAGIIAGHAAQVASSSAPPTGSGEMSGVAATAVHAALNGYCGEFSQRLSAASTALVGDAGAFTAVEDANCAALASVGDGPVRDV